MVVFLFSNSVRSANCQPSKPIHYKGFPQTKVWLDDAGNQINAQGGGFLYHDGTYVLGRDFETGQQARDMNVFLDDDGTAYHIYSSENNSTLHISKLTDDYLDHSGEYARAFENRWMEGPAMTKRNGKYYLIASDCTGYDPNAARSASVWNPQEI